MFLRQKLNFLALVENLVILTKNIFFEKKFYFFGKNFKIEKTIFFQDFFKGLVLVLRPSYGYENTFSYLGEQFLTIFGKKRN